MIFPAVCGRAKKLVPKEVGSEYLLFTKLPRGSLLGNPTARRYGKRAEIRYFGPRIVIFLCLLGKLLE
jgi:hypothetical protein